MSLILVECGYNSQKLGSSLFLEMNWSQSLKNAMPPFNNNTSMLLGAGVYSVSCCSTRSRRLRWLRLWCLLPDLLTSALWIHCSFWVSCSVVSTLPLWKSGHKTQEPLRAFTLSFLHFCQSSHWLGALNRVHFPWPDDVWNFSSFQYDLSLAAVVCHAVQWFPLLWACTGVPCVDHRGAAFTNTSNYVCI